MTKRKNRRREEFQKVIPSDKDHLSSVNVFLLAFLHVTIVTKLTDTKINPCQTGLQNLLRYMYLLTFYGK